MTSEMVSICHGQVFPRNEIVFSVCCGRIDCFESNTYVSWRTPTPGKMADLIRHEL